MISVRNNYAGSKSVDIDINKTVTISLRHEEYDELVDKLNLSMAEKIKAGDADVERWRQKFQESRQFLKEIREVFYDCSDDFAFRRSLDDVDSDELWKVLEKYANLLGFE